MVIGDSHVKFNALIRGDRITGEGMNDSGDRMRLNVQRVGPISKAEIEKLEIIGD